MTCRCISFLGLSPFHNQYTYDILLKIQNPPFEETDIKQNKAISDGGITVDFGLSKSILPIDNRIAGDHQIAGDHRIAGDH